MPKPRTKVVEFLQQTRANSALYNKGDVVRLPRRLARTLITNHHATSSTRAETGSTVMDLHASAAAGHRPKARRKPRPTATKPNREIKANGTPEEKGDANVQFVDDDDEFDDYGGDVTVEDVIIGLGTMSKEVLKKRAIALGLSTEGRKAMLVARLSAHLRAEDAKKR